MSDKPKKSLLSKIFNGAAIGAGSAVVAAAILPVITVSAPVIAIGAAIGGIVAYKKNNDDNGPKFGG